MTVWAALQFSDGSLGRFQFPDGVTNEQIDALFAKNIAAWSKLRDRQGNPAHEARSLPVIGWRRSSPGEFPADPAFRDAWRFDGQRIRVDMPAAREIHRGRLRALRAPLLEALDIAYMRADELGDREGKLGAAVEKQRLRDLPADPRIEAAATPEELLAVGIDPPSPDLPSPAEAGFAKAGASAGHGG